MRNRIILIVFVVFLSFFHFSPKITQAAEKTDNQEIMAEEENAIDTAGSPEESVPEEEDPTEENQTTEQSSESSEDLNIIDEGSDTNKAEALPDTEASEEQEKEDSDEKTVAETEEKSAKVPQRSVMQKSVVETPEVLEVGVSHPSVITLKEKLNAIGFDGILETEYYGNWTKTRVEDFQSNYGLPVTGAADTVTLEKLDEVYESPFQYGNRHEETVDLKEKLNRAGFGYITVTTYYGSFTKKQVAQFQEYVGLKPNGIADAYTRKKLDEILEAGYQEGDRHEAISDMKEKLNALGFGNILVTDYFGSFTTKRVTDFQSYYGIEVTGTANQETLNKLDALMDTPFQYGGRDDAIIPIKEKLNALGFGHITVTSYYGAFTRSQVEEFQSYYGLVENGIADDPTRNKLDELMATPFQQGERHKDIPALKQKLNKLGFGVIKVTDYYGAFTVKKVREFQEFYGLKPTGMADALTRSSLEDLYNKGFKQGDSHPVMNEFKEKLNKLGFGKITVTDYFGSYTTKKVKEFQTFYGLNATGRINAETIDKLNKAANSFYSYGDRHSEIKEIKRRLNAIGFGNIQVTSYFGSYTKKKVSDFQQYYDLPVSGKADPITIKYLEEVYNTPFQVGQRHGDTPGLKEKLNRLGFGKITVTTFFGNYTKQKVEDFQAHYGLVENGLVDEPTLNMLNQLNSTSYQKGKRASGIVTLKENLNAIGYGTIKVTDYYGSFTEKKVKEFQRDVGLPVSGMADKITRKEIEKHIIKVFLDPGHGDHDPGGRGYGLKEKDVVLDIGLRASEYLSSRYYGVTVGMSRTADEFIELEDRASMANSWGADYFVSLHTNALNGSANGFETFIHDGNVSQETRERQRDVHTYLSDKLGINDRGMKEANFSVLRNSNMPALLLEYMFIDNTVENALLKNSSYRDWLGKITAEAIAKSFDLKRR